MLRRLLVALTLILFARAAVAAETPAPDAPANLGTVGAALAGTWQSTNDTKLSREFDIDGKTIERYEGDESATTIGRWTLFLGSAPPPGLSGHKFEPKNIYLQIDQNGDVLLFALAGLSRSEMRIVYLERSNVVLSFARLQ